MSGYNSQKLGLLVSVQNSTYTYLYDIVKLDLKNSDLIPQEFSLSLADGLLPVSITSTLWKFLSNTLLQVNTVEEYWIVLKDKTDFLVSRIKKKFNNNLSASLSYFKTSYIRFKYENYIRYSNILYSNWISSDFYKELLIQIKPTDTNALNTLQWITYMCVTKEAIYFIRRTASDILPRNPFFVPGIEWIEEMNTIFDKSIHLLVLECQQLAIKYIGYITDNSKNTLQTTFTELYLVSYSEVKYINEWVTQTKESFNSKGCECGKCFLGACCDCPKPDCEYGATALGISCNSKPITDFCSDSNCGFCEYGCCDGACCTQGVKCYCDTDGCCCDSTDNCCNGTECVPPDSIGTC